MKKQVINADECEFEICVMPHGQAHGLYLVRENFPKHLLVQKWTVQECKNWLFSHFVGEKGTKFTIKVNEGKIVADDDGLLYLK